MTANEGAAPTSVVYIRDSLGQGSGVLISPDEVLTASHVVTSSGTGVRLAHPGRRGV